MPVRDILEGYTPPSGGSGEDPELYQYVRIEDPLQGRKPIRKGGILPISTTPDGGWQWDMSAGIPGAIRDAVMLPGDVYTGKTVVTDPRTGHTSREVIERGVNFAGMASPTPAAMRAGERAIPGAGRAAMERDPIVPPTGKQLVDRGSQQYDAIRGLGVEYSPAYVAKSARNIIDTLHNAGRVRANAPKTYSILEDLATLPAASGPGNPRVAAPVSGLMAARAALKDARLDFANPAEKAAAEEAIRMLDDLIGNPAPEGVVAGPIEQVGRALAEANANYGAGKRSQTVQKQLQKAEKDASSAHSGFNLDNNIRQRAKQLFFDDKKMKGFSPEERAAVEAVMDGTADRNTTRYVGKLLGGGGGLGALMTGGVGYTVGQGVGTALGEPSMGGMIGGAAAVTGHMLTRRGNAMAQREMQALDEMVRSRSPMHQQMQAQAPMSVPGLDQKMQIARLLALGMQGPRDAGRR
jgi:hypothetical protein